MQHELAETYILAGRKQIAAQDKHASQMLESFLNKVVDKHRLKVISMFKANTVEEEKAGHNQRHGCGDSCTHSKWDSSEEGSDCKQESKSSDTIPTRVYV